MTQTSHPPNNSEQSSSSSPSSTPAVAKKQYNRPRKHNSQKNSSPNNNNGTLKDTDTEHHQFDPQTNELFVYSPKEPLLPQRSSPPALNPNSTPFVPGSKPPASAPTAPSVATLTPTTTTTTSSSSQQSRDNKRPKKDKRPQPPSPNTTTTTTTTASTQNTKPNTKPNNRQNNRNNNNNNNNQNIKNEKGSNPRNENREKPDNRNKNSKGKPNVNNSVVIIYKEEELENMEFTPLAIQMINKIQNNSYECMICYENISKKSQVINCSSCYTMFHMNCIHQWANKSNPSNSTNLSTAQSQNHSMKSTPLLKWKCPGCRFVHESTTPYKPTCYCGKVRDPQYNPYFLPHSCGEVCGKAKGAEGSSCPHKCTMQCHPGACLSCSSLGETKHCHCGKTNYRILCGEVDKGKSCENVCGKELNCHKHKCADQCHPGECKPCAVTETQKCYCGKSIVPQFCGSGDLDTLSEDHEEDPRYFSCHDKCGRTLNCGNHQCQRTCHKGACAPCLLTPEIIKTCPCSQSSLAELGVKRDSCLDDIPTCPKKCNKLLICGEHSCQEKCHTGDCPPCKIKVKVACRCGKNTENRQCGIVHQNMLTLGAPFTCNNVCRVQRSCKKHECGIKCCPSALNTQDPSGSHVCTLVCGRTLKCGIHKCQQLCHQNKCFGCYVNSYEELACPCGKTVIQPPVPCGTKPPMCLHPCTKVRECGHQNEQILTHACHNGPCPPCTVLIERMCSGGHEMRKNIKCSNSEISCGKVCGKILCCLKHTCPRTCHSGPCLSEPVKEGGGCGLPCGIPLSSCPHGCSYPCHPNETCPANQVCKQKIKLFCPCQRRSIESICTGNDIVRQLDCDEICEREERDKKLREAFGIGIDQPTGIATNNIMIGKPPTITTTTTSVLNSNAGESEGTELDDIQYESLQLFCKASPKSIKKLEDILHEYLSGNNLKLTLRYTDSIQHFFIIQIAKLYQFRIRDRPLQNLVEVFRKSSSQIPSPKLSDSIQVSKMASPVVGGSQSYAAISLNSPVFETQLIAYPTILFKNLNEFIKSEHIQNVLQEFEGKYKLVWVDTFTCLCVFNDQFNFNQANQLKSIPFDKTTYIDDPTLFDIQLQSSLTTTTKSSSPTNSNSKPENDFYSLSQQMNKFSFLEDELTNNNNRRKKPASPKSSQLIDSFDREVTKNSIDLTKIENWESDE